MNIHPAVPGGPVGTERAVIDQLLVDGARTTGVTAFALRGDALQRHGRRQADLKQSIDLVAFVGSRRTAGDALRPKAIVIV